MSHSPDIDVGTERSLRSRTRNPRRRQRPTDPESVKTAPRRKRSKISENAFVPPRHDEVDEEGIEEEMRVNGSIEVDTVNGDAPIGSPRRASGRARRASASAVEIDIPLHSKKPSTRRPRGDGSTILMQTERYSLKLLPSTPKDLRKEGFEWRGSIGIAHLALAVTRTKAYVWDYAAHSPVTNPKVFELPFPTKPNDPLPFAALVSTGASTETGLVIISASTGKVVFYESVERAASRGLFQDRNVGAEGSLGSLFSGETVADIVSAHHAGFILPLTSGRLAHLTLRDAQGKPRVFAQFLKATESNSGGLFGSIKGFLGTGAWKRNVAAMRTRQLGPRGHMQVISLTTKAELQTWDLEWSGQSTFRGTMDFREVMTQELRKLDAPELAGKCEHLQTEDFVILDGSYSQSNDVATFGTGRPLDILVLLRAGRSDDCEHVIAGVMLEGHDVAVHQLLKVPTYRASPDHRSTSRPRLLLPAPGHSAIAVFPDAMVIRDLDQTVATGPGEQLQAALGQSMTFEDAIYLRNDKSLALVEAYEESDKSENESALAFVNGAGLVRLTITKPQPVDEAFRISIKDKIEQAVFHGALQDGNILDFSHLPEGLYSTEEVTEAALGVSAEILTSTSPFISTTSTSMESHLLSKAQALRALVTYVRQSFPTLSKETMWSLLWDAEKVAAAQQLWTLFERQVATCEQNERISVAIYDVCRMVNEQIDGSSGESSSDDAVQSFFIHQLHHLDKLLTLTQTFLRDLKDDTDATTSTKLRMVREGNDIWILAMETVFNFRTEHASTYGILPQSIENSILVEPADYVEFDNEIWTSTSVMLKAIIRLAELSRQIANDEFEAVAQDADSPLASLIGLIGAQNPRLIDTMCTIYQEHINWTASRQSDAKRELAERLREAFDATRHNHIRELADIAQAEAGIRLAEKYRDMGTLTEMVVAEMQFSIDSLRVAPEREQAVIHEYTAKLTKKVNGYFERFGDTWATAYFDEGFSSKHAGILLRDAQEKWQASLTSYLRAEASRAKICWINDITSDNDFKHAFGALAAAAQGQATKVWEKKVELSLSKLCLLAVQEDLEAKNQPMDHDELYRNLPNGELEIVDIQSQLYRHLLPEIRHCIDHQAEVEVAMQRFGFKNQDLHALKQLLESFLDRVVDLIVLSADELIDVLTLLDNVMNDDGDLYNLQGSEFFIALKVLNAIAHRIPQDRFDMLQRLIWKRCYVYDDWHDINNGQKQTTNDTAGKLQDTAAYRTLAYALDSGYLDAPDSHIRFLAPSECLGAGCRPDDLNYRWPDPDLLDPILKDNKIQDEQLQSFVDDRRLDDWIKTCVEEVKSMLEDKAESEANRLERQREFESSMLELEANGSDIKTNGHLLNGDVNGAVHGEGIFSPTMDEDGNVDMAY